jgi:hypothetical protein
MYCVYHKESTYFLRIFQNGYWQDADHFKTRGAATQALNRAFKTPADPRRVRNTPRGVREGSKIEDYAIMDTAEFHKSVEKTRMTRNILNPKAGEFPIPVNTPASCDPGTETYHCM